MIGATLLDQFGIGGEQNTFEMEFSIGTTEIPVIVKEVFTKFISARVDAVFVSCTNLTAEFTPVSDWIISVAQIIDEVRDRIHDAYQEGKVWTVKLEGPVLFIGRF